MNWEEALKYAEGMEYAGYSDWRLPNAKELQYLVDYTRSPDTTNSAAIDPIFEATSITNEAGQQDWAYYWTSTTHLDGPRPGTNAAYVSFGRAIGQMRGKIMDVHGAGAQRSDPKTGEPAIGKGPQGDSRRVDNYVRLVRGDSVEVVNAETDVNNNGYPNVIRVDKDFSSAGPGNANPMNRNSRQSGEDFPGERPRRPRPVW